MVTLLEDIKSFVEDTPGRQEEKILSNLVQVLKRATTTLKNPVDAENLRQLAALATQFKSGDAKLGERSTFSP